MDILTQLGAEHKEFRKLLTRLQGEVKGSAGNGGPDPATYKRMAAVLLELIPRLARHEAVERRVLFVEILKNLPDVKDELTLAEVEHDVLEQKLQKLLRELPDARPESQKALFRDALRLVRTMRRHLEREEALFGLLRKVVSAKELERLGRDAEWVRAVA